MDTARDRTRLVRATSLLPHRRQHAASLQCHGRISHRELRPFSLSNRAAGYVAKDAGDGFPGRLILGMAVSAKMDDGFGIFRLELHAAAALAGSTLCNQRFASGRTSRFVRFRSTCQGARPGLDRTYKTTSSRVLG